ncbi:MAG: hypothetical protein H6Q70_1252 [Firmicutes bacterium]|nr:hypothetical protein [Bacillota bacterium]
MSKKRLGLSLLLSFLATLATIPLSKSYHMRFGIVFSLLSIIHAAKHQKSLKNEFNKECECLNIFKKINIPTTKFELIMRNITVSHYSPGRIRLHSKALINNSTLALTINNQLAEIKELNNFSVNIITGSILLVYSPENLIKNLELQKIEQLVLEKYKRS